MFSALDSVRYDMGVIPTQKNLGLCEKLAVSALCRRRLPVVLVRLRMAQTLREAVTYIEQGRMWRDWNIRH